MLSAKSIDRIENIIAVNKPKDEYEAYNMWVQEERVIPSVEERDFILALCADILK